MPTYNRERFLPGAIESVLSQDYPHLELLVLDDGSSDGTAEILKRYQASHPERFRFTRDRHMGQARTLNRAFELARGEFLGQLSDDDLLLPGAVTKLAEALLADPEVVVAYPAYQAIDERGDVIDTVVPIEYSMVESVRLHDCIVGPGALFRRAVVDRIGGWNPEYRYCPDWDFWMRASALGPFRRITEPLACYRWHNEGITGGGRGPEMLGERVKLIDSVYSGNTVPKELLDVRAEAYRNTYICAGAYASGPGVNRPEERFYVADRLWTQVAESAGARDLEAVVAELLMHLRRLEGVVERDREQARALEEHARGIEAHRDALVEFINRPWWWHAARRLAPNRLRSGGKRLARSDQLDAPRGVAQR